MQLAFEIVAAKPKGDRAEEAPVQEPMRGSSKQVRKNPSTDQKRVRRKLQRAAVRFEQCAHCHQPIHDANGIDPNTPWVHEHSGNTFCDVDVPEDAVWFRGTEGRPEAEPLRHHATTTQQMALNLNGGEYIRGPNGSTMQVHHVTPYAANPGKVLLHFTDGSAMAVDRNAQQEVVPGNQNMVQRELADDMGQVGGNFNYLPGTPQSAPSGAGRGISPGSFTQEHKCPQCGQQMQMHGNGDMECPHCGFTSMVGMAEGHSFMKDPAQAIPTPFGGQVPTRRTSMLDPHRVPAIARRAQQVLAEEGTIQC